MCQTTGHLEYYTRHGINPVRYDMADIRLHFERRASLYRTIGVTPLAVRGARVLEVAPGTGQNSLYLASLSPRSLTLVEPNPYALRDIAAVYKRSAVNEVRPRVIQSRLEDFETDETFDLVLCENWLGRPECERGLLGKLGSLVAECGLLVVTAVSPVGVLPNILRRALASKLHRPVDSFEVQTERLCRAFGPHLKTVAGMTRSVTDWVHDNMMNPAYCGVVLPVPVVIAELGEEFDALGSSPDFKTDWRWFKGLCGSAREFNQHLLDECLANAHNFFDHRTCPTSRDSRRNELLEAAAIALCDAVQAWEAGEIPEREVETSVRRVLESMADLPGVWSAAIEEFLEAFADPRLTPEAVAEMPLFSQLFGRETLYLSFEKK